MNFRRLLSVIAMLSIAGCNIQTPQTNTQPTESRSLRGGTPSPIATPVSAEPKSEIEEAKLIAVGDIMMHSTQTRSGYDAKKQTYNFDSFFAPVKSILSTGDWVIGNLETPLAGEDAGGYTGYPLFNAPAQLADAAKKAGFNILTTANNHALDRGEKGVIRTIANLRDRKIASTGTAESKAASDRTLISTKNNISLALLAYTYGTNGIPVPKGKDYLVSLIDEKKIIKDIAKARKQGADIIAISLHFGNEYQRQPNTQQKQLVENLLKAGADIILGSHPHVVQPYKIFKFSGKNGKTRKAVAIYSMGNFISGQNKKYTDLGVIFQVNIRKIFPEKTTEITEVKTHPTWVQSYSLNNKLNYRVLPLAKTVTDKKDPLLATSEYPVLTRDLQDMNNHLNSLNKPQDKK
ncbi:Capsule synthesis protein, CapA [Oscillatoria nigro-viridis PCC 7112]|uniref:Capsule synthesis protein, CapA n=1 Tax=Phormidium nigroviride PCC 7112 TaxID=179408 RepID=K9VLV4_9CYAN|nr:CapA family protein [Oscillatoria nigro-viridis]AFZ08472.1 Capsule synthesis protein, CapA [Oscillatoria nigro-viridis PCC 7112]